MDNDKSTIFKGVFVAESIILGSCPPDENIFLDKVTDPTHAQRGDFFCFEVDMRGE